MGMHADDADNWMEAMDNRDMLRDLFNKTGMRQVPFTKQYFPDEPHWMLRQQQQLSESMTLEDRVMDIVKRIDAAKEAEVGETIQCPGCARDVVKRSYQHKYCKEKVGNRSNCKDFVNNMISDKRRARAMEAIGELPNKSPTKGIPKSNPASVEMVEVMLRTGLITKAELRKLAE